MILNPGQTEMNNILEGINSRITEAEAWINNLEDRMQNRIQKKRMERKKKKDSLRDLWDNIKHMDICTIGVPETEEREKGPEEIFEEVIAKKFSNMGKEIVKSRKH